MKRLFAMVGLMAMLCTSCAALPAEERAFAVVLCVEREGTQWRVHGRIPTYQTGGGYLTVSGEGEDLNAALSGMEASAPMRVTLSQLRLLVLDEVLAESGALSLALQTLAQQTDMHLQCSVALTSDPVQAVAEALKPSTGARLSKYIDVLLKSRVEQGMILPARLSQIMRMGERQSPVLIALTLKEKDIFLSGGYALDGEMQSAQRLTEDETALLSLLLKTAKEPQLILPEGTADVREISVKTSLVPDDDLAGVELGMQIRSSSLTDTGTADAIASACAELLSSLSRKGCDVLGMGRKVVVHTRDMVQWHELNWPAQLRELRWKVSVQAEGPV